MKYTLNIVDHTEHLSLALNNVFIRLRMHSDIQYDTTLNDNVLFLDLYKATTLIEETVKGFMKKNPKVTKDTWTLIFNESNTTEVLGINDKDAGGFRNTVTVDLVSKEIQATLVVAILTHVRLD